MNIFVARQKIEKWPIFTTCWPIFTTLIHSTDICLGYKLLFIITYEILF